MGRHGNNATASAVYTYAERKKDNEQSGYGTQKARLGTDSVRNFDCCCLSNQPCREPLVTPDGYIFEKESIYENLLTQKRAIARKLKQFERQKTKFKRERKELLEAAEKDRVRKFEKQEMSVKSEIQSPFEQAKEQEARPVIRKETKKTAKGKVDTPLPSFWIPGLTPEAAETQIKKPDTKTRCPMTGKPLKLKDLTPVNFTLADPTSEKSIHVQQERYKCAVTHSVLRNTVQAVVLRPSGRVVTEDCVKRFIKPDMIDPISGEKLLEKDLIYLQMGGSGFAGSHASLEKQVATPAMMAG
eukprot:m.111215 g.111215  ORF g.111215 m.111215 type:complete len:300 (-) comp22766_c0_seq2:58-957(-)